MTRGLNVVTVKGFGRARLRMGLICVALAVTSGCAEQLRKHGYLPSEEELAEVIVGIDTRDTVSETMGPPTTAGVLAGSSYYYVGDTVRHFAWHKPRVIERQIVEVAFDEAGVVRNITRYGLEDGRVVPLVKRVTESTDGNLSFVRRLFGNIGGLDTTGLFGG